ncbi:MAG: NifB/NifX family molybdenum-iron cluster-binding protein [Collinsella sp.]
MTFRAARCSTSRSWAPAAPATGLAGLLANGGVDTLICGGIGGGAINALAQAGITVYAGAQGSCDACVEALIAGTLAQNGEATCGCHGHDHDHGHAHEHGESCSCHGHHEHEGHEAAAATNGTAPRARGASLNATQQSKPTTKATR